VHEWSLAELGTAAQATLAMISGVVDEADGPEQFSSCSCDQL
jgi:hypothetical protein